VNVKTVVSDQDRYVAVGPHYIRLKQGRNDVPAGLVDVLVAMPGINLPKASVTSGASSGGSKQGQ